MKETLASLPRTPVRSVGNDFFNKFTVIVDRLDGKMTFVRHKEKGKRK